MTTRSVMRNTASLLLAFAACVANAIPPPQLPLGVETELLRKPAGDDPDSRRQLHGRFLHITDVHPDPFYKYRSSTEEEDACHRGVGSAGVLGAETTECDSPISLVNETFKWIDANLKDSIDFVIWTGDSARHDNDEEIPRTEEQVVGLNELLVQKFVEVFGKEDHINDTDPTNDFTIPIVPNFGNNDILPHNIFSRGPNRWTKKYTSVWEKFIPEEQRHAFERGGWFYVEVIPNKLAVFSLNTLYFFDSNSAVDGCADKSEPGYEQMEWLRIQLQFVRDRGMKAILMGHVPPARTESKRNWDETCWQKYTLWMRQYRDVVVGSMYGHMNLDHFLLQDSQDIDSKSMDGLIDADRFTSAIDDELSAQSSAEYLTELRAEWSELPDPPTSKSKRAFEENILDLPSDIDEDDMTSNRKKGRNRKGRANRRYLKKIGGRWGERYSVSLVSPSVIPKYFPTLRVMHYNITGLEHATLSPRLGGDTSVATLEPNDSDTQEVIDDPIDDLAYTKKPGVKSRRKHRKSKKKHKKPKKPKYVVPNPPSRSSPPGPAYSPQTLTWLGFTQYYANLTEINIDYDPHHSMSTKNEASTLRRPLDEEGDDGNDSKTELSKAHRKTFEYEVEYDTRNDSVFKLEDLTVKSWLNVARRIGEYKPESGDRMEVDRNNRAEAENEPHVIDEEQDVELEKHKSGKKKHRKHKKRKAINKVWFTFARRAYVNTRDDADLHERFGEEDLLST